LKKNQFYEISKLCLIWYFQAKNKGSTEPTVSLTACTACTRGLSQWRHKPDTCSSHQVDGAEQLSNLYTLLKPFSKSISVIFFIHDFLVDHDLLTLRMNTTGET